jgi:transposase-like protein
LIASAYLAGTNTRRVRRALKALFAEGIGKDVVSRVWRRVKSDWDAWNARSLAEEPIVRLILDGTVVRVRLSIGKPRQFRYFVIGVRADGQKMLLAIKSMGGESTEAWRAVLDDLIKRGLRRPQFLIVDGAPGLEKALAVVWEGVPVQRCTVHKHRNLLAHAPERLHDEVTADYTDMIGPDRAAAALHVSAEWILRPAKCFGVKVAYKLTLSLSDELLQTCAWLRRLQSVGRAKPDPPRQAQRFCPRRARTPNDLYTRCPS